MVLVDHAAEHLAAPRRRVQRHHDRLVMIGWPLLLLTALAAAVSLVGPWLLDLIVDAVKTSHGPAVASTVDRLALIMITVMAAQLVLARYALYLGARFGERTAARIREGFLDRTLSLLYAVTGEAAAGDLVAWATIDVSTAATTLCNAASAVLVAGMQALFILGAVLALDPLLGLCGPRLSGRPRCRAPLVSAPGPPRLPCRRRRKLDAGRNADRDGPGGADR